MLGSTVNKLFITSYSMDKVHSLFILRNINLSIEL